MSRPFDLEPAAWAQLRQLLDEALELDPAEQAPWVDALPDEYEPLKPHLRRLLGQAGQTGAADRFETMPRIDDQPVDPAAAMPIVGPYHCLRLLGEGGMSSVWLAERTDVLLNRPVALKLPRAAWRHAGLAQRMAQEREILGVLEHPNIGRIYDAGVAADGQPWLALELIAGQPIDEHCRSHQLDLRSRVKLFKQVAEAVAHAHAKLVVHRDLKPSNILVTPAGVVKLLDFGIAKLVGEAEGAHPDLTVNAARVMTPRYAAPEQVLGQPISTATDIYALGVLLFELLTGQLPYKPARDTAAALEEAVLHAQPARPSTVVSDRRLRRALAGDLDTIVLKALKKAPHERYGTATALADDLDNWLTQRPVRAQPDSVRYRAWKFAVRNRLGLGIAGALLLSLTAGLAAALWQADRAQREAAKALAIKDYLVSLFEANNVEQHDGVLKRQQSVQQLLEQSVHSLGQGLGDQPEVRDELQQVVGRLLDDLELTDSALIVRRQRVEQLQAQGADAAKRVVALRDLAVSQRLSGDIGGARAVLAQALSLCEDSALNAGLACQIAQLELAGTEFDERHIEAALMHVEPTVQALRRIAPRSIELADAIDLVALLRIEQNRGEDALPLFQESIALRRDAWGAQSVKLALARYRVGVSLWVLRHLSQAEAEMRAAWDIVSQALGPDHITSVRIELALGRLTLYVGLRTDGLAHIRHASGLMIRQSGQLNPLDVLEAHTVLGNALVVEGRLDEAGPQLEQALALRERLGDAAMADPKLDQSYARYLLDRGRFAEARAWLTKFRDRIAFTHSPAHPDVGEASLRIANVCIAEGRFDEAQQELKTVFASQDADEQVFGSVKHKAQLSRAALLLEQGRADEAQPLIDAQLAAAQRTPREDQFRDVLYSLYDLSARAAAQRKQFEHARKQFEHAIALMVRADAQHPYLATTRARFASSLLEQGLINEARQQLDLARAGMPAEASLGPQFVRPLQEATARLALAERSGAVATSKL